MSERAREFVDNWIDGNIRATGYEPEGDETEAKRLTLECWRAVDQAGIPRHEVEVATGGLTDHIASAIERVNDAEVQRQVDKDRS